MDRVYYKRMPDGVENGNRKKKGKRAVSVRVGVNCWEIVVKRKWKGLLNGKNREYSGTDKMVPGLGKETENSMVIVSMNNEWDAGRCV